MIQRSGGDDRVVRHEAVGRAEALRHEQQTRAHVEHIDAHQGDLRDLLTRLPRMTNKDNLDALLPSNWTPPVPA